MSNEKLAPETPQNAELVAKIRTVIESHACWDEDYSLQVEEYDFDDLAKDIAETFAATSAPRGKDDCRESPSYGLATKVEALEKAFKYIEPDSEDDTWYIGDSAGVYDALNAAYDLMLAVRVNLTLNAESPSQSPTRDVGVLWKALEDYYRWLGVEPTTHKVGDAAALCQWYRQTFVLDQDTEAAPAESPQRVPTQMGEAVKQSKVIEALFKQYPNDRSKMLAYEDLLLGAVNFGLAKDTETGVWASHLQPESESDKAPEYEEKVWKKKYENLAKGIKTYVERIAELEAELAKLRGERNGRV